MDQMTEEMQKKMMVSAPQTVDISKMSIVELKALAYDQLALVENCQKNLAAINQEISKRNMQPAQTMQQ